MVTDVTAEEQVQALIEQAEQAGQIELALYNAGNNYSSNFLEMEASLFEQAWRVGTLGGFLFARETLRRMVPRNQGTLIFTGASASLRGKPRFAPFTAAKRATHDVSKPGQGIPAPGNARRPCRDRRHHRWGSNS